VVENGGLGRHVSIYNTKLSRVGRPRNIVDRTLLVQGHAGIESTGGAKEIQGSLAVVTLAWAINVSLCQNQNAGAKLVPLQLNLVSFEEGLLGDGVIEERNVEDLDGSGLTLALRDKDGDSMILAARSEGEVGGTLDSELVPDRDEVVALVELDLVCYKTSTVLLISCVLKVPALLLFLNKAAQGLLILTSNALLYNTPDLEVLGGIAILILARALPGNDESATGRETEFVNVEDRERKDLLTSRGINNGDNLRGGPTEVTSTGRVNTVSEVALGLVEPSERLVDGRSVKDADGLLGSEGKLQRRRHG
jgi:hypothetical protein